MFRTKNKKAINIALNCIKQGMDNATIEQITGLSVEEIEKLKTVNRKS